MRRVLTVAAAATGVIAARRMATVATVRGTSMAPTFADGERVLAVRRLHYRRGDVVVFRAPVCGDQAVEPAWRIKRVAAVAGDQTPERQRRHPGSLVTAPIVPAGHVVVEGDNPVSQDSRRLGYVPVRAIAGRVLPARTARTARSD